MHTLRIQSLSTDFSVQSIMGATDIRSDGRVRVGGMVASRDMEALRTEWWSTGTGEKPT